MFELLNFLIKHKAPQRFRAWVLERPDRRLETIWATCPRGEWMLWLHEAAGTPWDVLEPVVYRAVNRAFEYAGIDFGTVTPENINEANNVAAWAMVAKSASLASGWAASLAADAESYNERVLCADDCRDLLPLPDIKHFTIN